MVEKEAESPDLTHYDKSFRELKEMNRIISTSMVSLRCGSLSATAPRLTQSEISGNKKRTFPFHRERSNSKFIKE